MRLCREMMIDVSKSSYVCQVEVAEMKGESIPIGWGLDKTGKETSSPWEVLHNEGWLSPLGGSEILSSHKGYGLGVMVEVFCGILSGESLY